MNRIYRKVWNKALGMWVVASELASGDARAARLRDGRGGHAQRLTLSAAIVMALGGAVSVLPVPGQAQSLQPTGAAVAQGQRHSAHIAAVTDPVNVQQVDAAKHGKIKYFKTKHKTVRRIAESTAKYFQSSGSAYSNVGAYVEGANAVAVGEGANAIGGGGSALGSGATTLGNNATAVGSNTSAIGVSATAIGGIAKVYEYDDQGVIIGSHQQATQAMGTASTAVGGGARALDPLSTAVGTGTSASGVQSTALGYHAQTFRNGATAVGGLSKAAGSLGTAMGYDARAAGDYSAAVGEGARATATSTVAMGMNALASGTDSVALGGVSTAAASAGNSVSITAATGIGGIALGAGAESQANYAIAMGYNANVSPNRPGNVDSVAIGHSAASFAPYSVSLGGYALASGNGSMALGENSSAWNDNSIALGARADTSTFRVNGTALGADSGAYGIDATAIGDGARVGTWLDDARNHAPKSAVALGAHSYASRDNSVSIGDVGNGLTRQITSVAAGTEATDAVNVDQLDAVRQVA
ncbi:ESPR-type extended signal peptide-containing protein, partial [Xanthomonas albilineans]|uniref:ESPR-type extended signal peptide-containing protein n=1 Tax=Xanthomonas albilineans TaxID=29447 RepID=UPI0022A85013